MSLNTLQSRVPSAVSRFGESTVRAPIKALVYDGQPIPRFILINGGDPSAFRNFLKENRIGSVFDLEAGVPVQVRQSQEQFSTHPGA